MLGRHKISCSRKDVCHFDATRYTVQYLRLHFHQPWRPSRAVRDAKLLCVVWELIVYCILRTTDSTVRGTQQRIQEGPPCRAIHIPVPWIGLPPLPNANLACVEDPRKYRLTPTRMEACKRARIEGTIYIRAAMRMVTPHRNQMKREARLVALGGVACWPEWYHRRA